MNIPKLRFRGFNEEWESKKLKDIVSFTEGKNYSKKDLTSSGTPIILYGQMYTHYQSLIQQVNTFVHKVNNDSVYSKGNEVILPSSGETNMDIARASAITIANVILGGDLIILTPKKSLENYFLALNLTYSKAKNKIIKQAQGKTIVHIHTSNLSKIKIEYPSIQEQQKIGIFFSKLDDLITKQSDKVAVLKQLKQGYLQKLFPQNNQTTPQLRFKGFNDAWQTIKLSNIYQKSKEKNTKLTFNQKQIISVASMHFNNDTDAINSTDDYMKTYNVMHLGDIAFEGHKSKKFFGGRFVLNDIGDGIVSHVFEVFSPIVKYDIAFMKHYIHNERVMHNILLHSTTKTLMMNTLNSKEFLQQIILLPTLPEQQKIGALFTKLDHLIALQNHKLELLQELKKGYLQKMFV